MRSIPASPRYAQSLQPQRHTRLAMLLIASVVFIIVVAALVFGSIGGLNLLHTTLTSSLHWFTAGPCAGTPAPC